MVSLNTYSNGKGNIPLPHTPGHAFLTHIESRRPRKFRFSGDVSPGPSRSRRLSTDFVFRMVRDFGKAGALLALRFRSLDVLPLRRSSAIDCSRLCLHVELRLGTSSWPKSSANIGGNWSREHFLPPSLLSENILSRFSADLLHSWGHTTVEVWLRSSLDLSE